MPYAFTFPVITSLPRGYDCTIPMPVARLAERLIDGRGDVVIDYQVVHEGAVKQEEAIDVRFEDGAVVGAPPAPIRWADAGKRWGANSGYIDIAFRARNDEQIFENKQEIGFYAIYSKPGKKSFFSDNAYKYGAPPVIAQIASFGRYVDGYPVVHLDREKDLGETITLINPYMKPILAEIRTLDGRALPRTRVPPMSARNLRLIGLLGEQETTWRGHIQITASNRLITYNVKHSLKDPNVISDHEHLDPFRDDPTHFPASLTIRAELGRILKQGRQLKTLVRET